MKETLARLEAIAALAASASPTIYRNVAMTQRDAEAIRQAIDALRWFAERNLKQPKPFSENQ